MDVEKDRSHYLHGKENIVSTLVETIVYRRELERVNNEREQADEVDSGGKMEGDRGPGRKCELWKLEMKCRNVHEFRVSLPGSCCIAEN